MKLSAIGLATLLLLQLLPIAGRSTIRGRVLDPDGMPMADVEISALLAGVARQPVGGPVVTDADGRFTITRVPAGRVILRAQPRLRAPLARGSQPHAVFAHPPAYFPGVLPFEEAWPIEVGIEELIELDFHMPPVLVGSIKAVVTGPPGYTLEQLRVMRPESNQVRNVTVDAGGIGYAEALREGRHAVVARARIAEQRLAAFHIVDMAPGELTVNLTLAAAAKITGRVVADRDEMPPLNGSRVVAAWTDGVMDLDPLGQDAAAVAPDGAFSIDGLFGRRAIRVAGLADGWMVASIRQGTSDVTHTTIDLEPGTTMEMVITVSRR